jgi:hypothetical protein
MHEKENARRRQPTFGCENAVSTQGAFSTNQDWLSRSYCMTTQSNSIRLYLPRCCRLLCCRCKILKISTGSLKISPLVAPFAAWPWRLWRCNKHLTPCNGVRRVLSASPVVYCSQYRMEEYERQIGPLPGNEKVGNWLQSVARETAYWSGRQRTSRTRNRRTACAAGAAGATEDHSRLCSFRTDACLCTRTTRAGRLPLYYYATGLQEGGPHDVYAGFDKRDIVWARRVRFHNNIISTRWRLVFSII